MGENLPQVPISQQHLQDLLASMLVYRAYRLARTPSSEERGYTLLVLSFLLPKLQRGIEPHEGELPLFLTVDEVCVMKGGLAMMIDQLASKPATHELAQEITRLKDLKALFDRHFSTTQD